MLGRVERMRKGCKRWDAGGVQLGEGGLSKPKLGWTVVEGVNYRYRFELAAGLEILAEEVIAAGVFCCRKDQRIPIADLRLIGPLPATPNQSDAETDGLPL